MSATKRHLERLLEIIDDRAQVHDNKHAFVAGMLAMTGISVELITYSEPETVRLHDEICSVRDHWLEENYWHS